MDLKHVHGLHKGILWTHLKASDHRKDALGPTAGRTLAIVTANHVFVVCCNTSVTASAVSGLCSNIKAVA